jgi:hypothetical protein
MKAKDCKHICHLIKYFTFRHCNKTFTIIIQQAFQQNVLSTTNIIAKKIIENMQQISF